MILCKKGMSPGAGLVAAPSWWWWQPADPLPGGVHSLEPSMQGAALQTHRPQLLHKALVCSLYQALQSHTVIHLL